MEKTRFLLDHYKTHPHLVHGHTQIVYELDDDDEVELKCASCDLGYCKNILDGEEIIDKNFTVFALEVTFLREHGRYIGNEQFWQAHIANASTTYNMKELPKMKTD
jgi:hypothetical protein